MKLKIVFGIIIVVLCGVIYSCGNNGTSKEDSLNAKNVFMTKEALQMKQLLISEMPKVKKQLLSRSKSGYDEEKELLSVFSSATVNMLKSYGFTDKDWEEFDGTDDPRFILTGVLFLAMAESTAEAKPFPVTKTRSPEEDDGSCWSADRIISCASFATGISEIWKAFTGISCITKTIAYNILKDVIVKKLGWVGVATMLWDFGNCMGWY